MLHNFSVILLSSVHVGTMLTGVITHPVLDISNTLDLFKSLINIQNTVLRIMWLCTTAVFLPIAAALGGAAALSTRP